MVGLDLARHRRLRALRKFLVSGGRAPGETFGVGVDPDTSWMPRTAAGHSAHVPIHSVLMPTDWTTALARIEELSQQVDDQQLRATVISFIRAASVLPAPDEVGLGYWRNSVRLTWASREVEVFTHSIEVYRFYPTGTAIVTISFRPGDTLPADIENLLGPDIQTHDVR